MFSCILSNMFSCILSNIFRAYFRTCFRAYFRTCFPIMSVSLPTFPFPLSPTHFPCQKQQWCPIHKKPHHCWGIEVFPCPPFPCPLFTAHLPRQKQQWRPIRAESARNPATVEFVSVSCPPFPAHLFLYIFPISIVSLPTFHPPPSYDSMLPIQVCHSGGLCVNCLLNRAAKLFLIRSLCPTPLAR